MFSSVLEAIGETPLVDLKRLVENSGVTGRILIKLEYLNPGFSKKDRIALQMIEEAEVSGALRPGQCVVELTSGNTGTGLAIVCAVKKHPFVAVMSRGNSIERARMMAALGAEVVLVDQLPESKPGQVSGGDLAKVEDTARRLVAERHAFRADQFKLRGNFNAHFLHTGEELWRQSEGQIDAFCDFIGTGGTFGGIQAALLKHNPDVKCFLVEPESCAVYAGTPVADKNHRIQGGGYSMTGLPFFDSSTIQGSIPISDREAIETARRLAREEGIFGGFSSGANVAAALRLLHGKFAGRTIAVLACDSGLKYLSTDLWPELE